MSEKHFRIASATSAEVTLSAELRFQEDRFHTLISCIAKGEDDPIDLLKSVNGSSQDTWPPTGTLQEILPQKVEGGNLIAGIGRSGKSHWSVVISATAGGYLEFDYACRIKEDPAWLGSTYELLRGEPIAASRERCEIVLPTRSLHLIVQTVNAETGDPGRSQPETQLDLGSQDLRISPWSQNESLPRTERWKYRMGLVLGT